jgi:hypothetical protein
MAQEYRAYPFESNPVVGIKEQGKDCVATGLWGRVSVGTAASPVQRSEASAPLAGSGSEAGASVVPKSD